MEAMRVSITIDVEQDCPPFRNTYHGITEGMPGLFRLFDENDIKATFFTTGEVARKFPEIIKEIVSRGHELGCHGNTHARLDKIDDSSAKNEITEATRTLRNFYPVVSFRAPCLQLPDKYIKHLAAEGYKIDSSLAKHKNPFVKISVTDGITRIPVSTTSLILRSPPLIRNFFLGHLGDPVILFLHPWELVDLRKESLRFDCRYRTGSTVYAALSQTIDYYKTKKSNFLKMNELEFWGHKFWGQNSGDTKFWGHNT